MNLRKVQLRFKTSTQNLSQPFGVAKQGWKANRNRLFHEIFLHMVQPEILQELLFSWYFGTSASGPGRNTEERSHEKLKTH